MLNFCLPLFIFLSAATFRLTNLDLVEFKGDEAINLYLAARPTFGYSFPPGSTVSSIGLLNPPFLNYLLYPITQINSDPQFVSSFISFINCLTIVLFYLIIKHYYQQPTALIASLLLAFCPWAIVFSRKIWPQDLTLPFFTLLFLSYQKIRRDKKESWWLVYVITSLFLIQLHQVNLFFIGLLTLFLLLSKTKLNLVYIGTGLILGFIPLLPYFIYLINNLTNPEVFLVAKERFSPEYFPVIFARPLQLMSQGNFRFLLGEDTLTLAQKFPLIFKLRQIFYLEYLLLPLSIFLFWKKQFRDRPLVYASLFLPTIYFFLHFEPFIHYFLIVLPLLFLYLAQSCVYFLNQSRFWRYLTILTLSLLIIISLLYNWAFFDLLKQQKSFKGDYGSSFSASKKEVMTKLVAYQNDPHFQEILLTYYLPKDFIRGYLPIGKMLYAYQQTKNQLPLLEEKLKIHPDDPRLQNELFVFYTATPPTRETLEILKNKSKTLVGYKTIYLEVVDVFNTLNH